MGADDEAPRRDPVAPEHEPLDALGRIAIALNSTMGLAEVLDVLAHQLLAHTGARRASLLLCSEDEAGTTTTSEADEVRCPSRLEPAVALAREQDVALWHTFRDAGPVELDDVQQAAFVRAEAVVVDDAAASELIPFGWAGRFGLECVVLVPLFAEGEPCGLLAVDYAREVGVPDAERRLLESMAEHAGMAVAKARRCEQTPRQAWLTAVILSTTRSLREAPDEQGVARCLASAVDTLLDAQTVAVARLDDGGWLHPLTCTGGHALPAPVQLDEVPRRLVDQVADWRREASRACQLEPDPWLCELFPEIEGHEVVLLGLPADGCPLALVLATRQQAATWDPEAVTTAEMLATLGVATLARHREDGAGLPPLAGDEQPGSRAAGGAGSGAPSDAEPSVLSSLTRREHDVLELVADGFTNEEIAERLWVSTNTVKTHVANVLHKLGVDYRRQAARKARAEGLGPPLREAVEPRP